MMHLNSAAPSTDASEAALVTVRANTEGDAIALCRQTIAVHSKSFALASRVLPPQHRDQAAVVYAWCRRVDDAIDLAPPAAQAGALATLQAELDSIYAGEAQADAVLAAFQKVVESCEIPKVYPAELLAGMEMDVSDQRYDTMDTLLHYCFRVAGTVGLMMSHVMGLTTDRALRNAAHLGIAMQLTNICRDVLEDWQRGRLYVPSNILEVSGAGGLALQLGGAFPRDARNSMRIAVRYLLGEARRYYRSGDAGITALPWRCGIAVRAARLVYATIGEYIANTGYDVLAGRAIVPKWRKLVLVARAGLASVAELPGRALRALKSGGPQLRVPQKCIEFPNDVLPL